MLQIDGSLGEGGGQVLRTSLALSLVTGTPFHITRIRAGRARPGLMRQHLTAVRAAASIGQAEVSGDSVGSLELSFRPRRVVAGDCTFAIGTAGSTTLVLQTVLPALLQASGPSTLVLEGGTHNPAAPPFDFLERAFLPLLHRMGPAVSATLERPGFFPAGGGRIRVAVEPARLQPLELLERGALLERRAVALVFDLPKQIGERELATLALELGWDRSCLRLETLTRATGPGNVVTVELRSEHVTEVFTGFGQKGMPAEAVAEGVAREAKAYLEAEVPVGVHLADQLLLPMALAGAGAIRTQPPSLHTLTQLDVLQRFLELRVRCEAVSEKAWQIEVRRV
jgi:RNA 3'-terminal phosphate cyclase (ATP)